MLSVKVCIGTSCHLKGSYNVMMGFQQLIEHYNLHEKVVLEGQFCSGNCAKGVSVMANDTMYSVSPEGARTFFKETILPLVK